MDDLRSWLNKASELGQLDQVDGADWNLEIGAITALNWRKPAYHGLIFDNIKGYPKGCRVLTSSTGGKQIQECAAIAGYLWARLYRVLSRQVQQR